jgi:hypothetical protein
MVKKLARQYGNDEGCLIFDDMAVEKAYMDENGIIRRHYGRGEGGNANGANALAGLCTAEDECEEPRMLADCQTASKTKTEMDGEQAGEARMK